MAILSPENNKINYKVLISAGMDSPETHYDFTK
jgi:hypothetical protein